MIAAMAADPDRERRNAAILDGLSDAQRRELEANRTLRLDDSLVWIEPEGAVRRERVSHLYYVRTSRGVFRYSKIDDALVEV
jgi:hypothetical protein